MAKLQTEFCVEIRVPLQNGRKKFGSGYSLGPHWILTAHHVLFAQDVNVEQPLKIKWWGKESSTVEKEKVCKREEIVWANEKLDIALIKCRSPYPDVPDAWNVLGTIKPDEWALCYSGGYLSNLHDEGGKQRRKTPSGKLGAFSPGDYKVDIDNLSVSLDNSCDWQGFSGAPVFVDGKLVAVVRASNTGEQSLTASLISEAMDAECDETAIRLKNIPNFLTPPADICRKRLQPAIEKLLLGNREVYKALLSECRNKEHQEIESEKQLVRALLGLGEDDITQCLFNVFSQVKQRKKEFDSIRVMKELACIWSAILAANKCTLLDFTAFKKNTGIDPYKVEIVEPVSMGVEAQAANSDNREPQLNLRNGLLYSPFDLTPGHRTGFVNPEGQAVHDIQESYTRKMIPGLKGFGSDDVKKELESFVTRQETGISKFSLPKDKKERGRVIGKYLKRGRAGFPGSFYVRFSLIERGTKDPVLREIREWCSELVLFQVEMLDDPGSAFNHSSLYQIIHDALRILETQKNEPEVARL